MYDTAAAAELHGLPVNYVDRLVAGGVFAGAFNAQGPLVHPRRGHRGPAVRKRDWKVQRDRLWASQHAQRDRRGEVERLKRDKGVQLV